MSQRPPLKHHVLRERRTVKTFTDTWVRKAEESDLPAITNLVNIHTPRLFGQANIRHMVIKRFLTLVLEDWEAHGEMVGAITLDGYPNVPSIPPWEWQSWVYNIYKLSTINPWNTLFVHYMVWQPKYSTTFLRPLLKAAFCRFHHLEYIIMVMPPNKLKLEWIEDIATKIIPFESESEPGCIQTLYLMVREQFMTKYKVRMAVVEDNDDLVPLINNECPRVRELYGEFYIAEILQQQDSTRKIIVAEHDGHAVAVLCLNLEVNVSTLNEQFELIPFKGLRKHDSRDSLIADDDYEANLSNIFAGPQDQADDEKTVPEKADSSSSGSGSAVKKRGSATSNSSESAEVSDVDVEGARHHKDYDEAEDEDEDADDDDDLDEDISDVTMDESVSGILRGSDDSIGSEYSTHLLGDAELEMRTRLKSSVSAELTDYLNIGSRRKSSTPGLEGFTFKSSIPNFFGDLNAFALEIAAARPVHEDALSQLIEAAFQCDVDRDYCVLTFPSTVPNIPIFNLFVKVPPRSVFKYEHDLYVLHRNAISGVMSVRWAEVEDVRAVQPMLTQMVKWERTYAVFKKAIESDEEISKAFVFCNEDEIVGLAVIHDVHDMEYLISHYDVFTWVDTMSLHMETFDLIEYFSLMPAFHMYVNFLLRELHRLSDCTGFFYTIKPNDSISVLRDRHLSGCLSHMVPIRGIVNNEIMNTALEDNEKPNKAVLRQDLAYSLYCSTIGVNGMPRVVINTKIVVVGASDCGLAFLHALVLTHCPFFQPVFTNLTIITPHGLSYQRTPHKIRDMMFVIKSHFNYRYMCMNSLRTYVSLCNGVLTSIDRKEKTITLNGEQNLPYDLLFLFCGEQHQMWVGMQNEFPENVFVINTETDAANAISKLKSLISATAGNKYTICVYGHELETYCCIAALLEYGIPGNAIVFVEPFPIDSKKTPPHTYAFFNDKSVDDAVQCELRKADITMYNSFVFNHWTYSGQTRKITIAHFQSKHQKLEIECVALFLYVKKTMSKRTFLAINRAGLVFDGRLVISPDCRTNDPCIYAAGTMTKYSRRHYADHLAHRYFNMCEIGGKLGLHIRDLLVGEFRHPKPPQTTIRCRKGKKQVPSYTKPLFKYCRLPGGLRYLHVRKPGKEIPLITALGQHDYGTVIITGNTMNMEEQGWFRLHLNVYNTVETITCLARFDIDKMNLISLYGKHVKLLNNVSERFEQSYITDLFEFFREPWTCALFHDKFDNLEEQMKDLMSTFTEEEGNSLIEDVYRMLEDNKWGPLSTDQKEEVEEKFMNSEYNTQLREMLMNYILNNLQALPMYAHPLHIADIMQGNENSPFFKRMYNKR